MRRGSRLWRRLWFSGYVAVATAVLLELVLQAGAVAAWQLRAKPEAAAAATGEPDARSTLLCIGDSWTEGMGSSDPSRCSYPAVLQSVLDEQLGPSWRVVNAGLAGQHSRDLLEALPAQLERYQPAMVLILIGQNDLWCLPERLVLDERHLAASAADPDAFRWRWRVPRLLAWLRGKLRGAGQVDGASPALAERGPEWAPRPFQAQHPYGYPDASWTRDAVAVELKRAAWQRQAAGDWRGATEQFARALERQPDDPQVRAALVNAHRALGEADKAAAHLDWLRARYAQQPDYWNGRCLVDSLRYLGKNEECAPIVRKLVARFPDDARLWQIDAVSRFLTDDVDGARASIEQAIARHPRRDDFHWRYKICLQAGDVDEAGRSIIRGYLAFNDAEWAASWLRIWSKPGSAERFAALLADTPCDAGQRQRLAALAAEALAVRPNAALETLASHLEQLIELCRARAAQPILLTYPRPSELCPLQERVATAHGVPLLDAVERFDAALRVRPWAELRASDGHCNDAGYEILGRFAATQLIALLSPHAPRRAGPQGTWRLPGSALKLALLPGGHGSLAHIPIEWRLLPRYLELRVPNSVPIALRWSRAGDQLLLSPASDKGQWVLVRAD